MKAQKPEQEEKPEEKPEEEQEAPILTEEEIKKREQKKLKRKRAQLNKKKRWFETGANTFVYMSMLPHDITKDELYEFAKKCGIVRVDPNSGE